VPLVRPAPRPPVVRRPARPRSLGRTLRRAAPRAVVLVALAVAAAVLVPRWTGTGDAVRYVVPAAEVVAARSALAGLPVRGRAPMTGYDRSLFGEAWADVDHNGCDTRNDVLARDLTGIETDPDTASCLVLSGTLTDPYSGRVVSFERGEDSADVQIDHVVALADAWQKGAQQWTAGRREEFANDPANLLAVDGQVNQDKGAGDAATWLPPSRGYRCAYAIRQVLVKAEYGLWVTQAEHDALARWLGRCTAAQEGSG